jgi:hypothetical protein
MRADDLICSWEYYWRQCWHGLLIAGSAKRTQNYAGKIAYYHRHLHTTAGSVINVLQKRTDSQY